MKRWKNCIATRNTPQEFDAIWRDYLATPDHAKYDSGRPAKLVQGVMAGDRVCELGCGPYGALRWLVENTNYTFEAHAVDFSELIVSWLKENCKDSRFNVHVSDARETPFPDSWFDFVTAGELIEHMEEPELLVVEMARICRSGGTMTISTVDMHCKDAKRNGITYPDHIWDFEEDDLLDLFEPHGETIYWRFGNYHMIECIKL